MIPAKRRAYLVELLGKQPVLGINELTGILDVSHMTIRRDIALLEDEGKVMSVSGGVRLATSAQHEPTWQDKAATRIAEKCAIARRALPMIRDGLTIYLDAGTTVLEIARLITSYNRLSVVTNNFRISSLLSGYPHIELFHAGGRVSHDNYSTVGPSVVEFLRHINVDIAFISSSSWHLERGVTTPNESKILVKQQLLQITSKRVLVADSSKYAKFGMFRACALEDFDLILTDDGLPHAAHRAIADRGIPIEVVKVDTAPVSETAESPTQCL